MLCVFEKCILICLVPVATQNVYTRTEQLANVTRISCDKLAIEASPFFHAGLEGLRISAEMRDYLNAGVKPRENGFKGLSSFVFFSNFQVGRGEKCVVNGEYVCVIIGTRGEVADRISKGTRRRRAPAPHVPPRLRTSRILGST